MPYAAVDRSSFPQDQHIMERSRETLRRSIELLQGHSSPDTFLGHKTQEPFPLEESE